MRLADMEGEPMAIDTQDIVRALRLASGYERHFDDVAGLAARISDDPTTLMTVAEEIRYEAWLALTKAIPDHSQFGEFRLLLRALVGRAASPGIVVDAGARERNGSNSYDLIADFGWRGVLIEALPERAAALRDEFGDWDYQVVECAVGLSPGRQPLWLGHAAVITSLYPEVATEYGGKGESIEVEVRRLADIMADAGVPHDFDLLSIDIEGIDIPVLNDLIETSPYRPRYVVIEAPHQLVKQLDEVGVSTAVLAAYREIGRTLPNMLLERI